MQCSKCYKSADEETFPCDGCKKLYCTKCSGICQSEVRVLGLKKNRVLIFSCVACKLSSSNKCDNSKVQSIEENLLKQIKNLQDELKYQNKRMDDQTVLINRLILEVSEWKSSSNKESYADMARNKPHEVIVVRPKEKQQSDITKKDIKNKIDPKSMSIAVEQMKNGKEGSVIINCNNSDTKVKIKETVENELGSKYTVYDGKQKDPKIIIRGVETEFIEGNENTILEALNEQNDLNLNDGAKLEVLSKFNQRGNTNKGNIILKVDVNTKNKLCQLGKLNIGWRRCVVHEYFNIIRCFKCARYGHLAIKCENNITCFRCAEPHKTNECNSNTQKCINCMETNNRLRKTLNINHAVTDINCPCYQRVITLEEKKTKK